MKPMMKELLLVLAMLLTGCGGLKLKDFNEVEPGMSKSQVIDILGEPKTSKSHKGAQILVYEAKDDDGDLRQRWVALEDGEVTFYGKPSEYKELLAEKEKSGGGATSNNTISNTANPTFNNNNIVNVHGGQVSREMPETVQGQETGSKEGKVRFIPHPPVKDDAVEQIPTSSVAPSLPVPSLPELPSLPKVAEAPVQAPQPEAPVQVEAPKVAEVDLPEVEDDIVEKAKKVHKSKDE